MEERYNATIQNRFHPDMSNKNITVEAKLISLLMYIVPPGMSQNDTVN